MSRLLRPVPGYSVTWLKGLISQRKHPCTLKGPQSLATRIGSVTRDQKVPGLNLVWVGCCQLVYQRLGGVHNCLWLRVPKWPLGVCRKGDRLPSPGFCLSPIYVRNSDERRRYTSFNHPTIQPTTYIHVYFETCPFSVGSEGRLEHHSAKVSLI